MPFHYLLGLVGDLYCFSNTLKNVYCNACNVALPGR